MSVYPLTRAALRLAGSVVTFAVLALVLLFAHGMHGQPLDALPSIFMWYLILGACRWLGRLLPAPAAASGVPGNDPLPPAAIAVSVAPTAPAAACPDFSAMKEYLPDTVARIVKR